MKQKYWNDFIQVALMKATTNQLKFVGRFKPQAEPASGEAAQTFILPGCQPALA